MRQVDSRLERAVFCGERYFDTNLQDQRKDAAEIPEGVGCSVCARRATVYYWLIWLVRSAHLRVRVDPPLVKLAPIILSVSVFPCTMVYNQTIEKETRQEKSKISTTTTASENLQVRERKEERKHGYRHRR